MLAICKRFLLTILPKSAKLSDRNGSQRGSRLYALGDLENMTIVRVGSTEKYASNWASAFGSRPNQKNVVGKPAVAKSATKGSTKKAPKAGAAKRPAKTLAKKK